VNGSGACYLGRSSGGRARGTVDCSRFGDVPRNRVRKGSGGPR
jgi:hypothetical protein